MPHCVKCQANLPNPAELIRHYKFVHFISVTGESIQCSECQRHYWCLKSLQNHFSRCHAQEEANFFDPFFEEPDNDNEIHEPQSENEENDINVEPNNPVVIGNPKDVLHKEAVDFIAYLYSTVNIPRNYVEKVRGGVSGIISTVQTIFKEKLENSLPEDVMRRDVDPLLNLLSNIFEPLKTEYRTLKLFENEGTYIAPKEIEIGERKDRRKENFKIRIVSVPVTAQYVPLPLILQKFFEQPDVLKKTLAYETKLLSETSYVSNFIQSEYWKKILNKNPGKKIFPVFLYIDDFETGNPLGSRAGVHKLSGVYMTLPIIPPEFRSTLRCIFLVMLFHSEDRKLFSYHDFFKELIPDLNRLSENGLSFNIECFSGKLHFQLALLQGDNLAHHEVGGFAESFNCNYPCIYCKVHKDILHFQVEEDENLRRTIEMYQNDLQLNNVSETGIISECVLNKVEGWHVVNSLAPDLQHDILEGTAKYVMGLVLHHCIFTKKYFTVEEFNLMILNFDFGVNSHENKPPPQTEKHLREKKIKMSSAEMLHFLKYLGVMYSNFVPPTDEFWLLYLALRKILSLILSPRLQAGCDTLLKAYVKELNELYLKISGSHLQNKFHHLVHYPTLLRHFGNLKDLWNMRTEGYHKISKLVASSVPTRKNLCKTIAIRHQLNLNWLFRSNQFYPDRLKVGPSEDFDIELLPNYEQMGCPNDKKLFKHCYHAEVNGTAYDKNMVVCYDFNDTHPEFAIIKKILIFNAESVHFIGRKLKVLYYDVHAAAYLVEPVSKTESCPHIFINQCDLHQYAPFPLLTGNEGGSYIASFGLFE
nr:PREDICTED: uncharacterized protein LOC109042788 [Bemisia tabaci]